MPICITACVLLLRVQVGLASIVASVQRSGGTVNHPDQKLDEALEDLGAGIEMQAVCNISIPLAFFINMPIFRLIPACSVCCCCCCASIMLILAYLCMIFMLHCVAVVKHAFI